MAQLRRGGHRDADRGNHRGHPDPSAQSSNRQTGEGWQTGTGDRQGRSRLCRVVSVSSRSRYGFHTGAAGSARVRIQALMVGRSRCRILSSWTLRLRASRASVDGFGPCSTVKSIFRESSSAELTNMTVGSSKWPRRSKIRRRRRLSAKLRAIDSIVELQAGVPVLAHMLAKYDLPKPEARSPKPEARSPSPKPEPEPDCVIAVAPGEIKGTIEIRGRRYWSFASTTSGQGWREEERKVMKSLLFLPLLLGAKTVCLAKGACLREGDRTAAKDCCW